MRYPWLLWAVLLALALLAGCFSLEERITVSVEPIQCNLNPWEQLDERDEAAAVKRFLFLNGVPSYEIGFERKHLTVCEACSCPRGDELRVLVDRANAERALQLLKGEVTGVQAIRLAITPKELPLGNPIQLSVKNNSAKPLFFGGCNDFVVERFTGDWVAVDYLQKVCVWEGIPTQLFPQSSKEFVVQDIGEVGSYRFRVDAAIDCGEGKPLSQAGCSVKFPLYSETFKVTASGQPSLAEMQACEVDTDCVKVSEGCCSCAYGGKNTAINGIYQAAWEEKLKRECRNVACPAVISNDASCRGETEAACVEGRCQIQAVQLQVPKIVVPSFEVLSLGVFSVNRFPDERLLKTRDDYHKAWRDAISFKEKTDYRPEIDFSTHAVAYITPGPLELEKYKMDVVDAVEENDAFVVTIQKVRLSLWEEVNIPKVAPYAFVKIPKTGKPLRVEWLEVREEE